MKFYKDEINRYYWELIFNKQLTAIHCDFYAIRFVKNGMYHNPKNADYISNDGNKDFSLNDESYGNGNEFTKQSWRRFVKIQAFL